MKYCDIYGEPTDNPDAATHCAKCARILTADQYCEEAECVCGADLTCPDSIITGRMVNAERERLDKEMEEWTKLNTSRRGGR